MSENIAERMTKLDKVAETACSAGNWNHGPYLHGMANGLILAQSIMKDVDPKYLDTPDEWKDKDEKKRLAAKAEDIMNKIMDNIEDRIGTEPDYLLTLSKTLNELREFKVSTEAGK